MELAMPRIPAAAALSLSLLAAAPTATAQTAPLTPWALRFAADQVGLTTLKAVAVPEPPDLAAYVRDRTALLRLGKALFWDAQVGSDGQACASCHFHAGADNRSLNQLDPGLRNAALPGGDTVFSNGTGGPGPTPAFGPNRQLTLADFPLHRLADPADRHSQVLSDTNDIVSSQGVFGATFVHTGVPTDQGTASLTSGPGAIFNFKGALVRSVEPRNTPSTVNAVFNDRNFWDARARAEFNGTNPIGVLDPTAQVVEVVTVPGLGTGAFPHPVRITQASAASQADGPPLSNLEMSFDGRRFADLGRKLLGATLRPLGQQRVAVDDAVLGPLSRQAARPGAAGLTTGYAALVAAAFLPQWWDGGGWRISLATGAPVPVRGARLGPDVFTVAEANFSLFFGLAVREYEATLVADDSPYDRFMEGDNAALPAAALRGLQLFLGPAGCVRCHGGPELTNAGVTSIQRRGQLVAPGGTSDLLERMIMGDGGVAVYDAGHYNIGVRPTAEDLGLGATIGPANLPLSNTRRLQQCLAAGVGGGATLQAASAACGVPRILARPGEAARLVREAALLAGSPVDVLAMLDLADLFMGPDDPLFFSVSSPLAAADLVAQARDTLLLAGADADPEVARRLDAATWLLPDPVDPGFNEFAPLAPPLQPFERAAVDGAFKVPGLRNVALTAPYFHNGGQATLAQVVEFYDRGGDFTEANAASADPLIRPLGLSAGDRADLVAFLEALTDERTRLEQAPFDHPSLSVPNGGSAAVQRTLFGIVPVRDDRVELPAVGRLGSAVPLGTAHTPFAAFPDPLR